MFRIQRFLHLSKVELYAIELGDEDGSHSFVQTGAIHVDHSSNWEHKPGWIQQHLKVSEHNYKTENRVRIQILDLAICWLTLFFSSMQLIVTGRVAELDPVPKAVIRALKV